MGWGACTQGRAPGGLAAATGDGRLACDWAVVPACLSPVSTSFPRHPPVHPPLSCPLCPPPPQLEQELYALPSDFTTQLEQELVLPGMVSTLAEVPLAAKDKLKSIEATEALKRSLLAQVGGR